MPKMTMRVILKSGVDFAIKCDKFTINRDGFGNVRGYDIGGIVENKPVYLDFEQVAAFVAKRTEARIAEAALTIRKIRTPVVPRRAKSPKGSRRSLPT